MREQMKHYRQSRVIHVFAVLLCQAYVVAAFLFFAYDWDQLPRFANVSSITQSRPLEMGRHRRFRRCPWAWTWGMIWLLPNPVSQPDQKAAGFKQRGRVDTVVVGDSRVKLITDEAFPKKAGRSTIWA